MGRRRLLRRCRAVRQLGQPSSIDQSPTTATARSPASPTPRATSGMPNLLRDLEPVRLRREPILPARHFAAFQPGHWLSSASSRRAPLPPADTQDYYTFTLAPGQSATIVGTSLNGMNLQVTLLASDGSTVLATGVGGATNATSTIQNFLDSGAGGTYYVKVTGDPGSAVQPGRHQGLHLQPPAQQFPGHRPADRRRPDGRRTRRCPGLPEHRRQRRRSGRTSAATDYNNNNCGCFPPDTNAADEWSVYRRESEHDSQSCTT